MAHRHSRLRQEVSRFIRSPIALHESAAPRHFGLPQDARKRPKLSSNAFLTSSQLLFIHFSSFQSGRFNMLALLVYAISLVGFATAQQTSFAPGTGVRSLWVSAAGQSGWPRSVLAWTGIAHMIDHALIQKLLDSLQDCCWYPVGFHSHTSKPPMI